jgi:hypothetical protein
MTWRVTSRNASPTEMPSRTPTSLSTGLKVTISEKPQNDPSEWRISTTHVYDFLPGWLVPLTKREVAPIGFAVKQFESDSTARKVTESPPKGSGA